MWGLNGYEWHAITVRKSTARIVLSAYIGEITYKKWLSNLIITN